MMMKSPSWKTRLLPTGGFNSARWRSIHSRKLNACRDGMCPPCLSRMLRAAARLKEHAMHGTAVHTLGARAALCGALLAVAACSHWPWHHRPPPPPVEVHELVVSGPSAATHFPQYWKRNTLLVDLSSASGSGSIALQPAAGGSWPVRLALRITRGSLGRLEVRGDQGVTLPITAGTGTVDLELSPWLYSAHTQQLTVVWGPEPAAPALPDATPPR